jgi:hypothetical protein
MSLLKVTCPNCDQTPTGRGAVTVNDIHKIIPKDGNPCDASGNPRRAFEAVGDADQLEELRFRWKCPLCVSRFRGVLIDGHLLLTEYSLFQRVLEITGVFALLSEPR